MPTPDDGADWIELAIAISTLIGAVAWPFAICLLVWWFRVPLRAKLNEATTVEAFGVKLLLADALAKAREIRGEFDGSDLPDSWEAEGTLHPKAPRVAPDAPTPTTSAKASSFERIAAADPRSAIQYMWSNIEERLLDLARAYELPVPQGNLKAVLNFLKASDAMPIYLASIVEDLRSVRNSAVHSHSAVEFSLAEALRFRDAGLILLAELDDLIEAAEASRHENKDGV
ncbi:hypothetical protein [Brevundimonas sp. GCM10030266]|uniref:hypothetical protein n=1 Tax=Brevundimonas sp. GCM10030266 TaxID=3273386 RepID=UPI0036244680